MNTSTNRSFVMPEPFRAPRARRMLMGASLSPREMEVVRLRARNLDAKHIAQRLRMKRKTVSAHIFNAVQKFRRVGCERICQRDLTALFLLAGEIGPQDMIFRNDNEA